MNCHIPEKEQVAANGHLQMDLYELNKQIISQLPILTQEEIENQKDLIVDYHNNNQGKYYMMLCNELKYYTIFAIKPEANDYFEDEVIDCLYDFVDNIKSIEYDNENKKAIEIWFTKNEETYVMYLFDYTQGVIECV